MHPITIWRNIGVKPYNNELTRLLLNQNIKSRLEQIHNPRFQAEHKVSLARSFEVFEIFNDTHYVFNHGSSGPVFLTLNILIKQLTNPKLSPFETFLRIPEKNNYLLKDFGINYYIENIKKKFDNNDDHIYTKELISVDANLASNVIAESALQHFSYASLTRINIKDTIIDEIAETTNNKKEFLHVYKLIEDEIIFNLDCKSILFTICVKKDYFNKCGYLSGPGGFHIECNNINKVLSELQNNIIESDEYDYTIPQVRLLTCKLNPKYVNVFIFPAMEDSKYANVFIFPAMEDCKYFRAIELVKHNLLTFK
ncbi:hypothetical protein Hokovirus_2_206 [Hokovirus HKV1]|uniref:Uncharacterized protein n=1 Tax=Hokovirus HKV1 TaxID=1977638 RepID=A0A1V0SG32_9VIRU|nr:hypothetical protein Hokovirus_2_206 [Hokovirus HKV1]